MRNDGRAGRRGGWWGVASALVAIMLGTVAPSAAAEHIKIGSMPIAGTAPVFIAIAKGYFAAEGLDAEFVPFDAGQPIAVATVSGALDFGEAGLTSALYTLAGEGALRVILGMNEGRPGFNSDAIVASNAAYRAGLTSLKDLGGHSVGLSQIGSPYHYALGILTQRDGIDLKTIRLLPLQGLSNVASAVTGGQADVGFLTGTIATPLVAHGNAKLLAWLDDVLNWQIAVVVVSTRTATERGDTIARFVRAMRRGTHDFYDAFITPDGRRRDGPTAPEITAIIAKYIHRSPEQVRASINFIDRDDRIDVTDIARQIAWYRAQGMLRVAVDADRLIDWRYAVALPQP